MGNLRGSILPQTPWSNTLYAPSRTPGSVPNFSSNNIYIQMQFLFTIQMLNQQINFKTFFNSIAITLSLKQL